MSNDVAIRLDKVKKSFKLPHERNASIKSGFINFYKRNKKFEKQQVLDGISFEIKKGEFFGIVGRNGSGKSTLLKLLAGIYSPDAGSIQINGKLTPFIELGVGFNQELSGRENVFLNGALLGFSRKEMEALYGDIVEFAGLHRFMDQKLKNYSSGMQVRLAFSIAIQAKSDILVLDEVLAVGDEAFQKKCIDVFENYKSEKQTVVLVTHDMGTVKRFCTRAMLINDGEIISEGDPDKVAHDYTELNNDIVDAAAAREEALRLQKNVTKIKLHNKNGVNYGDKLELSVDWSACKREVKNIGVAIYGNAGEYVFGTNTIVDKVDLSKDKRMTYNVDALLGPGNYHFKVGVFGETDQDVIELIYEGPRFTIRPDDSIGWQGITSLKHEWR